MLERIMINGDYRETRNAKTYSVFGERLEFDLDNGFPLLTTKKVFDRGIIGEFLLFLKGKTDSKLLEDKKIMIWHKNTTKEFMKKYNKSLGEFDMGPMYGFQWRYFGAPYKGCHAKYNNQGVDQLKLVVDTIVKDPHSRRILMTTYNPAQAEEGVLYPCHGLTIQFYVESDDRISLQMYQRSNDAILGTPYNIASYALLLMFITNLVNNHFERQHKDDYRPGRLIMIFGDAHIYSDTTIENGDHIQVARKQLRRRDHTYPFCTVKIKKQLKSLDDLESIEITDIVIENYISGPPLKAEMFA
jgi:thymidylate synthase